MSKTTVTNIMELTKWAFLSYLAVLTLTVGFEPRVAYASENGKECAEFVFDFGLPELEPEIALPTIYNKENLFKTTVQFFDSGSALFSIDGFEIGKLDSNEPEDDSTYATEEDLGVGGLDSEVSEYESDSLKAGDILKAVPSITTKDEKTLGILVPPFAYFSKKF